MSTNDTEKTTIVGYQGLFEHLNGEVSMASLRRNVHLGRIPCYKPFGKKGRTLFRLDEIDAWLANHAAPTEA